MVCLMALMLFIVSGFPFLFGLGALSGDEVEWGGN